VILKDIWGLPDREVERIALWMADTLVDAALREAQASPAPRRSVGRAAEATPVLAVVPAVVPASVSTRRRRTAAR